MYKNEETQTMAEPITQAQDHDWRIMAEQLGRRLASIERGQAGGFAELHRRIDTLTRWPE